MKRRNETWVLGAKTYKSREMHHLHEIFCKVGYLSIEIKLAKFGGQRLGRSKLGLSRVRWVG